jgi:hypothetical protein
MVKLQEAENQIIVDYEVYARRPNDADLLIPAIATHQAKLGRTPRLVAADAAFYSGKNEAAAKAMGVKRVCVPNRSSKSPERKREQKKRWFRNGQKWRTGCEGHISVVKRRNGLNRCRYKTDVGMQRWVALGVISDNLVNIGRVMSARGHSVEPRTHHCPLQTPLATPAGFALTHPIDRRSESIHFAPGSSLAIRSSHPILFRLRMETPRVNPAALGLDQVFEAFDMNQMNRGLFSTREQAKPRSLDNVVGSRAQSYCGESSCACRGCRLAHRVEADLRPSAAFSSGAWDRAEGYGLRTNRLLGRLLILEIGMARI